MLNGQSKFDKSTGNLLNSFLSHLPSPVCLVAHNGDCYDFPLLKAEMEKVNTPLDPLILCVDSYIGIKNIFKKKVDGSQSDTSRNNLILENSGLCIPSSFSLVNLHNHLLGFPPSKSHGAEADCLTLLRTTAALGQDWLDWVEENSYLIEGCKAMWHMV